jgi:hypothetical protein
LGTQASLLIKAQDPDGHVLTYTASGLPNGLVIDKNTGLIYGTPNTLGVYSVRVIATDNQSPALFTTISFQWNIFQSSRKILYRVNAGGGAIAGDQNVNWGSDVQASPSRYVNSSASNNTTGSLHYWGGKNTTGYPNVIFANERWDGPWGQEMEWSFPVAAGKYEVKLCFAETNATFSKPGQRVFDVLIENNAVLSNYDIIAQEGFLTAAVKGFTVTVSDGNLTIRLQRKVGNPKINGIEIVSIQENTSNGRLGESEEEVASLQTIMQVGPNPTSDLLELDLEDRYEGEVLLQLVDQAGNIKKTERLQKTSPHLLYTFDVADCPFGLYYVRASFGNASKSVKFLKN